MHDFWRHQIAPGKPLECLMRDDPNDTVHIVQSPDKVVIVVAGGAGLHSVFSTAGKTNTGMVTKPIRLPKHWPEVLARAKPTERKKF